MNIIGLSHPPLSPLPPINPLSPLPPEKPAYQVQGEKEEEDVHLRKRPGTQIQQAVHHPEAPHDVASLQDHHQEYPKQVPRRPSDNHHNPGDQGTEESAKLESHRPRWHHNDPS